MLALGEQARRESGGAFDVRRTGADGIEVLDPSGVVKGWAVQRAARLLAGLADTDSASRPAATWSAGPRPPAPPAGGSASRTRPTPRGSSPSCPSATAPSPPRAPPTAARTSSTAAPGVVPRTVASVTVVADDLTWADIDATAAYAQDARRPHLAAHPARPAWPGGVGRRPHRPVRRLTPARVRESGRWLHVRTACRCGDRPQPSQPAGKGHLVAAQTHPRRGDGVGVGRSW